MTPSQAPADLHFAQVLSEQERETPSRLLPTAFLLLWPIVELHFEEQGSTTRDRSPVEPLPLLVQALMSLEEQLP